MYDEKRPKKKTWFYSYMEFKTKKSSKKKTKQKRQSYIQKIE